MAITRQVITALDQRGIDLLGTKNVALKLTDDQNIVSGSLLTVESNHFCVLKSRGAILQVYETGQYPLTTPDKPLFGSISQGFFGGSSPWVYEVIYINRSKLLVRSGGTATTSEMAEVSWQADYYIHIDTKQEALDLIQHLPFNGSVINTDEISAYAGPAIEQAINQVIQVTPLESHQRAHRRVAREREGPPCRLPAGLRHHAERPEDPGAAEGRAHAPAHLAEGVRPHPDRGGALLPGNVDGQCRPRLGAECRGRRAVQHRRSRSIGTLPLGRAERPGRRGCPGGRREQELMAGFYELDRIEQVAVNLFYGWGYNFYREENQLRADSLLIRSRVSDILGTARRSVSRTGRGGRSGATCRHSPARTAATGSGRDQRSQRRLGAHWRQDICGAARPGSPTLPVPENDRVTQRLHREKPTLERLVAADRLLAGQAELLRQAVDTAPVEHLLDGSAGDGRA